MSLVIAPETIEFFAQAQFGTVEQIITLQQRGRVECMATSWFARFYHPSNQAKILPGTTVKAIGRQGLTLLVVPLEEDWMRSEVSVSNQVEAEKLWLLRFVQRMSSLVANLLS